MSRRRHTPRSGIPDAPTTKAPRTSSKRASRIRTADPARDLSLVFDADSVSLIDADHHDTVDIELPAEAFARLIYGRLDAQNSPNDVNELHLEKLRKAFPGI